MYIIPCIGKKQSKSENNFAKSEKNFAFGLTYSLRASMMTMCSLKANTAEPEPLKKITHWGYNRRHRNTLNRKNELKTSQQDLSFGRALAHF